MLPRFVLALAAAAVAVPGLPPAPAEAGPIADSVAATRVTTAQCLDTVLGTLGGDALHLEFESRDGRPTYEVIVASGGVTYYVGCDGMSGLLGGVDVIVEPADPRFAGRAKIDEARAREVALGQYKGEVEEVKAMLLSSGDAWYEVDVELGEDAGELNVWVDAETGAIRRVDTEYWEIGRPGGGKDDD